MKIDVINGLRGFAILAVIYHHLFWIKTGPGFHSIQIGSFQFFPFAPLSNGWLGVNLFFVLSGFVLALPYFDGRRSVENKGDVKSFYLRRGARILPLYYACFLLCMILPITKSLGDVRAFVVDMLIMATATFNFAPGMFMPKYNGVLWSLGIEIWFSVLFPFIILAMKKFGVYRVLSVGMVIALATRITGSIEPVYSFFFFGNVYLSPINDSVVGRLDDFLLGMTAAYLFVNGKLSFKAGKALLLFVSGLMLVYLGGIGWDSVYLKQAPRLVAPFINNAVNGGFFLVTISLLSMQPGLLRRLFENWFIQVTGMMCYSLYVWQLIPMARFVNGNYAPSRIALCLLTLYMFSALSYRYIEFGHVREWRGLFLLPARRNADL
jgi:peptidoglycan/LPS O-acetylase OafA/YrhL